VGLSSGAGRVGAQRACGTVTRRWEAARWQLPTGPDDTLVRLLYQFDSQGMTDAAYGAHSRAYFERQVAIYTRS
jgi:hypothetical protein